MGKGFSSINVGRTTTSRRLRPSDPQTHLGISDSSQFNDVSQTVTVLEKRKEVLIALISRQHKEYKLSNQMEHGKDDAMMVSLLFFPVQPLYILELRLV